ncbi:hypothetical protein IFM58399_02492 [Aspergillus lentulus]|nr:uncharacterized protein IFM58399_02492 [Aspergillus lentulus]GFF30151.1 hypothetical protein IFM58399_02492 [Aspergillus lentulus]
MPNSGPDDSIMAVNCDRLSCLPRALEEIPKYHKALPIHTLRGHYKAILHLSTTKRNRTNIQNTESSKEHNRVNMSPKSFKSTTTMDSASTHTTSSTTSTLKGMFTRSLKLKAAEKAPSDPKLPSKKSPVKDYTAAAVHHEAVAQYLALR